ncbi:MAG: hypothetical protein ACJ8F7_12735 [Gemmataceae bacterium]
MRGKVKRRVLLAALLLVAAGMGCNPFLLPQFISGAFTDNKIPPEYDLYKLGKKDKDKKELKLVVLPERGRGLTADFFGQERELANDFAKKLEAAFEENKAKVKIVPIKDVEAFKSTHSEWKGMKAQEIGKHFQADYVLDLELLSLSLYAPRSHQQFLQGSCRLSLTVYDVDKDDPVKTWSLSPTYPKNGNNQPVDIDNNIDQFRQTFYDRIAGKLVRFLTPSSTPDYMDID